MKNPVARASESTIKRILDRIQGEVEVRQPQFLKCPLTDASERCHRITYQIPGWRTSGATVPALKVFYSPGTQKPRVVLGILFRDERTESDDLQAATNLAGALAKAAQDAERLMKKSHTDRWAGGTITEKESHAHARTSGDKQHPRAGPSPRG